MHARPIVGLITVTLGLSACSSGTSTNAGAPVPSRGARTLAIDIGEADGETYDNAFQLARAYGIDEVKISLDWNSIENAPSSYDFTIPDIAEAYYPANGMPVALVFRPINTNSLTLPSDIASLAFDSATVIARFETLLNALAARMPSVTITRIAIGNEIDSYLGADASRWAAFGTFFQATKATAKAAFGASVPVGTLAQFSGHMNPALQGFVQVLVQMSDFVGVNYYPLNPDFTVRPNAGVATDFAAITSLYPGRSIVFQECGLPTGALCNSSEGVQSEFIEAVFAAWDTHATQITHIDFTWQTDVPASVVDGWVVQYGASGQPGEATFREYLATLGLRTSMGQPKQGWLTLRNAAQARGW